jgi:hypothetical protein
MSIAPSRWPITPHLNLWFRLAVGSGFNEWSPLPQKFQMFEEFLRRMYFYVACDASLVADPKK